MSENKDFDQYGQRVKRFFDQQPSKQWVFGVCAGLTERTGWEAWAVRITALVCLFFIPLFTIIAYVVLAMLFDETRPVAQAKLSKWAKRLDSLIDVIYQGIKRWVGRNGNHQGTQPADHGL